MHTRDPAPMNVDLAVIGGGIAGAAIAAELARDHSVVLLEAEAQPGYHSTGRSVAILDRSYGNSRVQALTAASLEPLRLLQLEVGGPSFLLQRGVMHVATALQHRAVAHFHRRVTTLGHHVEYRDGQFARSKVPVLRAGHITACAYDAEALEIDVAALLAGLLRRFRARGGHLILGATVESLVHERGRWDLRTTDRAINARVVVNAAGAWADAIATLAGGSALGLTPMRRTVCTVPVPSAPAQALWPFCVDIEETFYFKQEPGQLLVSPADETPAPASDAWPDDIDVALAVERLEAVCDLTVTKVRRSWAGLRSFFPDRTPAIGLDPTLPGFLWCAGLGGFGIQTALGVAACAAALIRATPPPAELADNGITAADFAPARLASLPQRQVSPHG
jgi:D-arginine dehydrogenase